MPDSQASEHALDYVEKTIGGKPVKFGKLSVRDRATLLQKHKAAGLAQRKADAEEAKLSPEQVYAELRYHNGDIWGNTRWVEVVNNLDGQIDIYTAALKRQGVSEADIESILSNLSLPQQEEMELLCQLACLPLSMRAPVGTKQIGVLNGQPIYVAIEGGDEANPTAAATGPQKDPKNPTSYGT